MSLIVLCGPMFAGKTEGLIDRTLRAGQAVRVYKPTVDTRHGGSSVLSHGGRSLPATWTTPDLHGVQPGGFVAIDEAQFLAPEAIEKVRVLIQHGTALVLAGLDLTYQGEPFGPMPAFLSMADEVVKLKARCSCGQPASRTFRKIAGGGVVLVGGAEAYEPRCLPCWTV